MNNIDLDKIQRIVFKFGTNVLRNKDGVVSLPRLFSFIEACAKLHSQGKEILIVTSGAVGLGAKKLGITTFEDIGTKQACAAVGQCQLMSIYEKGFSEYGINTAQILLTEDDFSIRKKYLCLHNTLSRLLENRAIPVINQNDTVSVDELESLWTGAKMSFSDNDKLAALVTSELDADLLVILSDIDGVFDANPKENPDAKLIPLIKVVDEKIEALGFDASKGGRGGMKTKLEAAKVVTRSGAMMIIANGKTPNIIQEVFYNNGKCTVFCPSENLSAKKRWIGYASNIIGKLVVNDKAKKAIMEKNSSLLPIGVIQIINDFKKGDVVEILDTEGNEFARGMINYNCKDCKKIMGEHSDKILEILGYKNYDAIITRDNMVLL